MNFQPVLKTNTTQDAAVHHLGGEVWRLAIPPGDEDGYRLAQLDDTSDRPRGDFLWTPPLVLRLEARVSSQDIPGTWGFGLWNDPFSLSLGLGGGTRRFPALPNAAWFFFGSPPNSLSFRDDMPAQGFLAQVFRSVPLPSISLALGGVGLPALAWPWLARKMRPVFRAIIQDESSALNLDVSQWHTYAMIWQVGGVRFEVDGVPALETSLSPHGRLGLVLWIDNQYAAFPPSGRLSFGKLPFQEPAWLEIKTPTLRGTEMD